MGFELLDMTAKNVLEKFRKDSSEEIKKEIPNFLKLTPDEQRELLFYQQAHMAASLAQLHEVVLEVIKSHNELIQELMSEETPH